MFIIVKQLFILYIFIFLGWFFGKKKKENREHMNLLSFLLVNLFLPCKVFLAFSQNVTPAYILENYSTIFISVLLLLILVVLGIWISRLFTKNPCERKIYRYSVTISNYAYLGYTLIENILGKTGLTNLTLFCIPFALYTYSFGYATLSGNGNFAKKLINPMTAALSLGIVFGLLRLPIPSTFTKIFESASACTGPLSMLLIGLVLSDFPLKKLVLNKKIFLFTPLRLAVLPLFVFLFVKGIGLFMPLPPAVYPSAVIMAAMPTGLNPVIFLKLSGEDCLPGAQLAMVSNLFSCLTIPIWLSVLL